MIEEVKKILRDFEWDNQHFEGFLCTMFHKAALQICQRFPKTVDNPDGYEPKPTEYTCQYVDKDESGEYIACSNTSDRVPCIYGQFDFCPPIVPKPDDRLLTDEKIYKELCKVLAIRYGWADGEMMDWIFKNIYQPLKVEIASIKDKRYKQAVKDSIDGKPLDLTGEEFGIFCAIENMFINRISKVKDAETAIKCTAAFNTGRDMAKDAEIEKLKMVEGYVSMAKDAESQARGVKWSMKVCGGCPDRFEGCMTKAECQQRVERIFREIERDIIYVALEVPDGTPRLHLQTNPIKSAEKWQALWEKEKDLTFEERWQEDDIKRGERNEQ